MWTKSYSITSKEVSKEQMWKLLSDVNNWTSWDQSIEMASLEGEFKKGNYFNFQPKGGPKLKIKLHEVIPFQNFTDETSFPLAKMYGEHLLEETQDGLKITTTMTVKGILSFLWVKLVAQKIVNDLPNDMAIQIKTAAQLK